MTLGAWLRNLVYGPLLSPAYPQSLDRIIAPMSWDLADLESVKKLLGGDDGGWLCTNNPMGAAYERPDTETPLKNRYLREVAVEQIDTLSQNDRSNMRVFAFQGEATDVMAPAIELSLGVDVPARLTFLGGALQNRPNEIAAELERYLTRRRVPRRIPQGRRISLLGTGCCILLLAFSAWGVTAMVNVSPPSGVLLGILSVIALVAGGNWVAGRARSRQFSERDAVVVKQLTRAEVDTHVRESRKYKFTILFSFLGGIAAAVIGALVKAWFDNT